MNNQIKLTEVVPEVQHIVTKEELLQQNSISYISCKLVRDEEKSYIAKKITSPAAVEAVGKGLLELEDKDIEEFWILHLSSRNTINALQMVSRGSLSESLAHPREVFKAALLNNSSSIILIHNHPSGDSNPSGNDKKTTERLVEAGKIIGIKVMDHVVIGKGNIYSFKENILI